MPDRTVKSSEHSQLGLNENKTGSGEEHRGLCDTEGRQIINPKAPLAPTQKSADAQVKGSAGTLYGFTIAFVGATAGDKIEIRDSTSAGGGTVIFTIICSSANETHLFVYEKGMTFSTGIYHDETKTTGTIYGTYIYE